MKTKVRQLTVAGMIAALYVVLTVVFQPIGYGSVQFRIAEMLTILPAYFPEAIPGLAVGCMVSNVIGLSTGANPAGGWDVLVGTAATALAAWLTYLLRGVRFKNLPLVATLPPVLINALAVGIELWMVYRGVPWYWHVAGVAAGQFAACTLCGTLLSAALNKRL